MKRKYNCSFFHPVNGLNGSTNIKVRTVHFALGLYRVRTDHKEDPEGVKMGAGICLFMYPRKVGFTALGLGFNHCERLLL